MAKSVDESPLLPPPPPPEAAQPCYGVPLDAAAYVLLPTYTRRRNRRRCCCSRSIASSTLVSLVLAAILLGASAFFLWPSDPVLTVDRARLDHIGVTTEPSVALNVSLDLVVRVRNGNFFSLDYRSLVVDISYRGQKLGVGSSGGGHIRARGVSYISADLQLDGIQVISDAIRLLRDLARGSIPFETTTKIDGELHLLFLYVPIQGRISCELYVNPKNQTVVRKDCYPE